MTDLRDQALTAAQAAIRDGQWWLPPAGQAQLVDAVLNVTLRLVAAELRGQAEQHDKAAAMTPHPELADGHRDLGAGFLAAAGHVRTLHRPTT
ncbi:hypothetical protein AB0M92_18905 [Streptomyces sp. NPDC051582]|uniref:hypothetical protein n=1 Tax=Streptomyces sp. NPDC051582 TaxID=3155167 RepID=UPI003439200D